MSRKLGANKIIGTDVVPERLEWARQLGLFDDVLQAGPNNVAEIRALTGGHGVECAIECSGNADGRAVAVNAAQKWGRIVIIGGPTGTPRRSEFLTDIDLLHDLRRNQKTVFNSWVAAIGFGVAVPGLFLVGSSPFFVSALVGLILFGVGRGFFDTNCMPIVRQISAQRYSATGDGFLTLAGCVVAGLVTYGSGAPLDAKILLGIVFRWVAIGMAFAAVALAVLKSRLQRVG